MAVTYRTREAVNIETPRLTRLQQEARIGLLFLSPWIIGFILFKALPFLAAFVFALTDFQMLTPEETSFVGLSNYIRFFGDTQARFSLLESLRYFLLTVPLEMVVALVLAAIFTSKRLRNKSLWRNKHYSGYVHFLYLSGLARICPSSDL